MSETFDSTNASSTYKLSKKVILTHKRTKNYLLNMVDVFFASGRLANEEYSDLLALIDKEYQEN